MGGGAPAVALTADLMARAVIAAAQAYGDDPVTAMTCHRNAPARRALSAAVSGICRGVELPMGQVAPLLGVRPATVYTIRTKKDERFGRAELAAMRAVEFALWRPDAAESGVGADGEDDLAEPEPEPEVVVGPEPVEVEAEPAAPSPYDTAHPRLPPAPYTPRSGPISAPLAMRPPRAAPPPAEAPTSDLLLKALAGGPHDSMSLAFLIDRKELVVVQSLKQLEHEGRVRSRPVEGQARAYVWEAA